MALLAAGVVVALLGTVALIGSEEAPPEPAVVFVHGPPIFVMVPPARPAPDPETAPASAPETPRVPAWVRSNGALNPWVEVAAAPAGTVLGVSPEVLDRSPGQITGFTPDAEVTAPTYDYEVQTHEVTWEELGRHVFAQRLDAPEPPAWSPEDPHARARMPATNVPWSLAQAYCKAVGGDLPSEAEWAWAARGAELRRFPWGDELPHAERVRLRRGEPIVLSQVATMSQDATPGTAPLHDLLGNAAEWTRDEWVPSDPDETTESVEGRELRAVRGWPLGGPGDPLPPEGLTYRRAGCADGECVATAELELIGFRCMRR